jgi:chromosome segregation protein
VYLKSLTLKGFKSFAQPTTFAFETGVTCVVGPNGSGKSNVVDALAWVMGEQGARTLRGGSMEDVIFAGTATRGPLGRAEVVLTIDNSDGALPIEYSEVTIGRTLFRGGGSEYAINGRGCRLLDVQELLSDSGLGREMHVIVGQGQLDAVLRASPEERRGFIEEAAGILKHRRRKEKTLRKLDAMQANLTRLSDLAGEVRRQLKPLGHQAEIAREAQSIASAVRDAKARLLADDVVALRSAVAEHSRSDVDRTAERTVLEGRLEETRSAQSRVEASSPGDAVDAARRTAFALESVQERLRALYTLANQRLALFSQQTEPPERPTTATPAGIAESEAEALRLEELVGVAEQAWAAAKKAVVDARRDLDALDEHIAAQSALVSRHDLALSSLSGRVQTAESRLSALRGEVARQQDARDAASARLQAASEALGILEAEASSVEGGSDGLDADYDAAKSGATRAEARADTGRDALHALERERDALAARVAALSLALDQKDGSSALVEAGRPGIRGLLAEHVEVTPGFEAAVAAAFGSLTDAVLADDRATAFAAADHAREHDLGRVELLLADDGADPSEPDARPTAPEHPPVALGTLPAGVVPATRVVSAPAGVLGLLRSVVIADDLDAARAAWAGLSSSSPDVVVVTRSGDVVARAVLRTGSGATRSRIELVADRDGARARLAEVAAEIDDARASVGRRRQAVAEAREASTRALAAVREHDARRAAQSERLNRGRVQVETIGSEVDRLERALALSSPAVAAAEEARRAAGDELDAAAARPRPVLDGGARDAPAAALEAAREREISLRLEVETARQRVRTERQRTDRLRAALEEDRVRAREAAERAVLRQRRIDAAERVLAALPEVLDAVDRSVSEARVALGAQEAERETRLSELTTLRREEAGLRDRLHRLGDEVHGIRLRLSESRLQLTALLDRSAHELGLDEEILVAEYGPDQPVPDAAVSAGSTGAASTGAASTGAPSTGAAVDVAVDTGTGSTGAAEAGRTSDGDVREHAGPGRPYRRAEQEARLVRAERMLARLGRVNPLALEEFAALEQRHLFLTEQLADLTSTRKDLLTIIGEIDEKMQDIFASAFADTKDAFDRVFPVLFPGGSGSLRLTDPDDLLATGIEVTVKPAGKKIERLSLLSGGERSLAAVALLIAIFKARPSPFYIMDEVEAALDDANLGRLLAIFEDLRETSQLIVITHQKRTMEIADALYGVSMRADGVSAVIGQRMGRDDAGAGRAASGALSSEAAALTRDEPEMATAD